MTKKSFIPIVKIFLIPFIITLTACNSLVNSASGQIKVPTQPILTVTDTPGSPVVTVKDQEYNGTSVIVADAFSQGPGWIVIHNQVDGNLGPAIGYTHINSGDNKNIKSKN